MKKLIVLTIALLTISALHATDDYVIRLAIKKGDKDIVESCVEGKMSVTKEQKLEYVELARKQVEMKQEACESLYSGAYSSLSAVELIVASVGLLASAKCLHEMYNDISGNKLGANGEPDPSLPDPKGKYVIWKGNAFFTLSIAGALKAAICLYKDACTSDSKATDLKSAEEVLEAVERLDVA